MNCTQPVTHTIQTGDTLYSLARRYDTTVTALLDLNPNIEVYNLQIGSQLLICRPDVDVVPPVGEVPAHYQIKELLRHIVRWVRENLNETAALEVIGAICTEFGKR